MASLAEFGFGVPKRRASAEGGGTGGGRARRGTAAHRAIARDRQGRHPTRRGEAATNATAAAATAARGAVATAWGSRRRRSTEPAWERSSRPPSPCCSGSTRIAPIASTARSARGSGTTSSSPWRRQMARAPVQLRGPAGGAQAPPRPRAAGRPIVGTAAPGQGGHRQRRSHEVLAGHPQRWATRRRRRVGAPVRRHRARHRGVREDREVPLRRRGGGPERAAVRAQLPPEGVDPVPHADGADDAEKFWHPTRRWTTRCGRSRADSNARSSPFRRLG